MPINSWASEALDDVASRETSTYFLAPNFDIAPDGLIRLGDIITDPFDPLQNLSRLPDDDPSGKGERSEILEGPEARKNNIWTNFQKIVSMSVGETKYEIETLETLQYRPTTTELAQRMSDPMVKGYFKSSFTRTTAYMVIGLKIARQSRASKPLSQTVEASVGDSVVVGAAMQEEISQSSETVTYTERSEFVVAYSLMSLRMKRRVWQKRELSTEPYSSGALF